MVGSGLAGAAAPPRWPSSATTSSASASRTRPRRAHSHRGAGRHQRRQELSQRRRQRLPPLLRHGQGRRLPRARGQRLPPGRGQRQHHRPVRGAGRAVRARVRRAARQPLASAARRCRAPSTRAARPASSCCSAPTRRSSGRSASARSKMYPAHRDARPDRGRRPGARHRHARPGHRQDRDATSPTPWCWHRRLRQRLLPLDQRQGLQRHRHLARLQARRRLRQSLLHADPPDLHPGHRRVPVEADADERVAAQRRPRLGARRRRATSARPARFPRPSATTTWSASTRASATWCRATSPRAPPSGLRRRPRRRADGGLGVYLDFARRHQAPRQAHVIEERYGNLFDMYERITGEDPYKVPMRIYPAMHYTMGGLWVDYNLMSTIPGLFVIGEANFSDHGANRLGASALMQGLADGYFILPVHHRQLPGAREARAGGRRPSPRVRAAGGRRRSAHQAAARRSRASARSTRSTASSARSCGTTAAWPATRPGLRAGARSRSPSCARSSGTNVQRARQRRGAQPVAREGRPRRRLPRARRADVPRRAGAQRILRRPLPRGVPDARRRGPARRRATSAYVAAWEYPGRGPAARPATRAADLRDTCTSRNGATSRGMREAHLCTSGGRSNASRRKGKMVRLRGRPTSTHDMSFLEMLDVLNEDLIAKGEEPDRLRPRLPRGHLRHVRLS